MTAFSSFRSFSVISALVGWASFHFQMVPLAHLLTNVGFASLPVLLMIQVLLSTAVLLYLGSVRATANPSKLLSFNAALALTFVISVKLLGNFFNIGSGAWLGLHFIAGQVIVATLRLGLELYCADRINAFSASPSSNRAAVFFELGTLVGGLSLLLPRQLADLGFFGFVTTPLLLLCLLPVDTGKQNASETHVPDRMAPYRGIVRYVTYLFFLVALAKTLQWLLMAYGIVKAEKSERVILRYFSGLAAVQAMSTIASITLFSRILKSRHTWKTGYTVTAVTQILMAISCIFSPTSMGFVLAETVRRAVEHSSLLRSQQMLIQDIPKRIRYTVRKSAELLGANIGTLGGAMFFYAFSVTTKTAIPSLALICCVGVLIVFSSRRLDRVMRAYFGRMLKQQAKEDVIHACSALAEPSAIGVASSVRSVLRTTRDPEIQIACLRCLTAMKDREMTTEYRRLASNDREDVQMYAIRALAVLGDYDSKIFLIQRLREEIRETKDPREKTIQLLTECVGALAVPYLLEVLERSFNERIKANAIETLGRYAKETKDTSLQQYLSQYLQPSVNRRMRANAVVALFWNRRLSPMCRRELASFMRSSDRLDRGAAAFIAGALKLRRIRQTIWEWSNAGNHSQISMLVSLLRLNDNRAVEHFALFLTDKKRALNLEAIASFAYLKSSTRLRVLEYISERHPIEIANIAQLMRESGRNFEQDLRYLEDAMTDQRNAPQSKAA